MLDWLEISVNAPASDIELVNSLLDSIGCIGTAFVYETERNVRIVGYLPATEDATEKLALLMEKLEKATSDGLLSAPSTVTTKLLDAEEWEAHIRQALPPLKIGSRFLILFEDPSEPSPLPEGRIILRLRSLGGFGTGHHPTTHLCLELLEECAVKDKRVLDIGTGSGILAIAAVKLGAAEVIATDVDDVALEAAKFNAELNGVTDRIQFLKSDLLRRVSGTFDIVLSNLLANLIKDLAFQIRTHRTFAKGGVWIGSGVSTEAWAQVKDLLFKLGYQFLDERRADGWVAFLAKK